MNENRVWIDIVLLCLLLMLGSWLIYCLLSVNAPIDGWINEDDESD